MAGEGELLKKFGKVIDDISEERKQERKLREEERRALLVEIGQEVKEILQPALEEIASRSRITSEDLKEALSGITVEAPIVDIPPITVPQPRVTVNVPDIRIPDINIPDIEVPPAVLNFPDELEVKLKGINMRNPLPVILTDTKGNPYIAGSMAPMSMGRNDGGGIGGFRNVIALIRGMESSTGASLVNPDGQLRVAVSQSGGGTQFADGDARGTATGTLGMVDDGTNIQSEIGSSYGIQNVQLSGFDGSLVGITSNALNVAVTSFTSSVAVVAQNAAGTPYDTGNGLPVNIVAGSSSGTQYNDGATPDQAGGLGTLAMLFDGGSAQSVNGSSYGIVNVQLSGFDGSLLGITSNALNINISSNSSTLDVKQVSGDVSSVIVNGTTAALDVKQVSGDVSSVVVNSTLVALDIKQVSGSIDSVNVVTFNGTAPDLNAGTVGGGTLRVVVGNDSTTMVVGNVVSDGVDDGSGPVKTGGVARTANPTAVAAGDRITSGYDKIGRQLMRPVQVRELLTTARASLTTGTETTLLASGAGVFNDLVWITASNNSSASVTVDIRDATAGGIVLTLDVPANGVVGVASPIPFPQNVAADTWTADMPDITGTTVVVSALFTKEV